MVVPFLEDTLPRYSVAMSSQDLFFQRPPKSYSMGIFGKDKQF